MVDDLETKSRGQKSSPDRQHVSVQERMEHLEKNLGESAELREKDWVQRGCCYIIFPTARKLIIRDSALMRRLADMA